MSIARLCLVVPTYTVVFAFSSIRYSRRILASAVAAAAAVAFAARTSGRSSLNPPSTSVTTETTSVALSIDPNSLASACVPTARRALANKRIASRPPSRAPRRAIRGGNSDERFLRRVSNASSAVSACVPSKSSLTPHAHKSPSCCFKINSTADGSAASRARKTFAAYAPGESRGEEFCAFFSGFSSGEVPSALFCVPSSVIDTSALFCVLSSVMDTSGNLSPD
mmetsp:Transcript_120/g.365  ORF Transcript_120/g.365 Transcript_120/m.365 type:complete len:224 (+) Transcript_120:29-700(+)